VTERRGRNRKQLLDDLKKMTENRKLKEKTLARTLWRTHFGRGYGAVIIETTKRMNYFRIRTLKERNWLGNPTQKRGPH
jgi:hypothetical protein